MTAKKGAALDQGRTLTAHSSCDVKSSSKSGLKYVNQEKYFDCIKLKFLCCKKE